MNRTCNKIKQEIEEEQCVFVQNTETRKVVFIILMLSERAIQMLNSIGFCFINIKAFSKIRYKEYLEILKTLFTLKR